MYLTLILSCRPRLFLPAVHNSDTFTDTSPTSITSRRSSSSSRARRDDPHVGLPTDAHSRAPRRSRVASVIPRASTSTRTYKYRLFVSNYTIACYRRAQLTLPSRHVCSCSSMMMTYSTTYRNNLWITTITVLYATPFRLMLCPGRILLAGDCEGECLAPTR